MALSLRLVRPELHGSLYMYGEEATGPYGEAGGPDGLVLARLLPVSRDVMVGMEAAAATGKTLWGGKELRLMELKRWKPLPWVGLPCRLLGAQLL